ncbi:MAG: fumarylacetoacetate hydrolase family protein [Methanobacterium sp.]|uniref:fumarylacetoacetate hydrolase family protein n=1 Tax=Methanobacterium sp. TaxID=2164 RepID=UPI003D654102|nr:fumarylacetoacetate hydrolase family protein [Methanobacterium sp.]
MKIIQFRDDGKIKTGLLEDDYITTLLCSVTRAINSPEIDKFKNDVIYKVEDVKIKAPISPSKIVCVGLNYTDHAAELKMEIPDEPIIFIKPVTSLIGHLDSIIYPDSSSQVDYEVELGIVISKEAKNVKVDEAENFIGGYTVLNDVTARDLQQKDVQWTRAKSFDTFCPIGPCIETDLNPMNQEISLTLNGEVKQKSNTKNMIFNVYELVEFISDVMTLKSGDIIATGTPPGVGPMSIGDAVAAEVEGIGILKNIVE